MSRRQITLRGELGVAGTDGATHEKIFERFFRVEGDHERTYPGFGIGLYISAEIVKRHGGEICVESAPGKGSTFSFTIPLAKKKEIKKGKAPSKKKGRKK